MRAFIAIEFPESFKDAYSRALGTFREWFPDLRWVRPECVHLTLRFLGELTDRAAVDLRPLVEEVVAREEPFKFCLGMPGFFGAESSPRVFWFSVDEGRDRLENSQPLLEGKIRRKGYPADNKPFRAHVTVARSRGARKTPARSGREGAASGSRWIDVASSSGLREAGFTVKEWSLVSSELTPKGPVYTPVWKVRLGAE